MTLIHVYRCKKHGEFRLAMAPSEWRRATGSPVLCPTCGAVLYYNGTREEVTS